MLANKRFGDEIIDEDSNSSNALSSGDEDVQAVNTRHYERDSRFASQYYFITNVIYLSTYFRFKP